MFSFFLAIGIFIDYLIDINHCISQAFCSYCKIKYGYIESGEHILVLSERT